VRKVTTGVFRAEDLIGILDLVDPGEECRHQRTAQARVGNGPGLSFFCSHGVLIACCGMTIYWEGLGEVWLVLSPHARKHYPELAHLTGLVLDAFQYGYRVKRLQADVLASDVCAINFVRHYGFEAEGLMKCYDVKGRDMIRFARIREV
jgi:hypothetical protein